MRRRLRSCRRGGRNHAAIRRRWPISGLSGRRRATRDNAHADECKRLAEQTDSDRANCLTKLNLPKIYCDASYAPRDPTAACTLPDKVASVIEAELARARFRCTRVLKGEEGKL